MTNATIFHYMKMFPACVHSSSAVWFSASIPAWHHLLSLPTEDSSDLKAHCSEWNVAVWCWHCCNDRITELQRTY